MNSIMSKIRPVTPKLFALELLEIVVHVCIFTICYCSSTYIYWWILILLHTNVGYNNISSKFTFQCPGLKVKVTGYFYKNFVIALAPAFIDEF